MLFLNVTLINPYPKLISLAFSKFLFLCLSSVGGNVPGGGRCPGENCPDPVLSPHPSAAAAADVCISEQSDSLYAGSI